MGKIVFVAKDINKKYNLILKCAQAIRFDLNRLVTVSSKDLNSYNSYKKNSKSGKFIALDRDSYIELLKMREFALDLDIFYTQNKKIKDLKEWLITK